MASILSESLKHGWSIIPTRRNKKASDDWAAYQTVRPDSNQLKQWLAEHPPCWAVITGELSGVIVVDFDGPEGLKTLEAWGLSPHVQTGSGGRHVYVQHPGVRVKTNNGKSTAELRKLAPGVDIRGDGGYAVFHGKSNKGEYVWLRPMEPDPWEVLPEPLRNYITRNGDPIKAEAQNDLPPGRPMPPYNDPRYWLDRYLGQAIVGSRNQMGFHLALELVTQCVQFGTSIAEVESICCEYARRVPRDPKDPYTEHDAKASLRKALDYGYKTPCGVPAVHASLIQSMPKVAEVDVNNRELATYAMTDLGNAERFLARHRNNVRYCANFGKWFIWDGLRWQEDEIGTVVQLAATTVRAMLDEAKTLPTKGQNSPSAKLVAHARKSESDAKLKAIINLARSWVGIAAEDLDADPWLLNCVNGVYDLRSMELFTHRPENLITKLVPYSYDPAATCPHWLAFLDQIFKGNTHLIDYIQRAVGYALTGVIREQCLFFLHGKDGANGKSTFLSVVQDIMGDYSRDTPTESLMIKQSEGISNDIARLKGARLVTAVETEADRRMAESLVKRLTGGDTITARFMRQEFFQFRGTFKIFLAANHKPSIRGTDNAIWRRIKLIPFLVEIPEEDQDPDLKEKLKTEALGILTWMIEGCRQWQDNGLGEPSEVTEATAFYRNEMDYLGPFIEDFCVLDESADVSAAFLYRAYCLHCEDNNNKPLSQARFGRILSERSHIKRGTSGHEKTRIYQGLTLNADVCGRVTSIIDSCKSKDNIHEGIRGFARPQRPQCPQDDEEEETI